MALTAQGLVRLGGDGGPARVRHRRADRLPRPDRAAGDGLARGVRAGPSGAPSWTTHGPELVPWLRAADEAAELGWPRRCAPRSRSTARSRPSGRTRRTRWPGRPGAGRPRSRSPNPAGVWPATWPGSRRCGTRSARTAGSGSTPTGPGRWTRPSKAIRELRALRPGVRRAALPHGGGAGRAPPPTGARRRSTCRSRPTSRSAGPTTRTGSRALRAADIAVLKVQPLGGVRACLEIAERIGLPVVVSSALETSIGLRAGLALAAALPELPYACGLNTAGLLADDLVTRTAGRRRRHDHVGRGRTRPGRAHPDRQRRRIARSGRLGSCRPGSWPPRARWLTRRCAPG